MAIFPCKPGSAGSPLGSSSTCSGNQGMVERKRSKSEWEWKTTEKPQFWPNFVIWGSCIHPHCRSGPNFMCERVPRVYSSPPNFTLIVVYCYPRQAKNCCNTTVFDKIINLLYPLPFTNRCQIWCARVHQPRQISHWSSHAVALQDEKLPHMTSN